MRIPNSTPGYINHMYENQSNNTSVANQSLQSQKNTDETLTMDSISFSSKTKDMQKISTAMDSEVDDRKKYVEDIKQRIETSQYDMNAETVAEKMVGTLMNEII